MKAPGHGRVAGCAVGLAAMVFAVAACGSGSSSSGSTAGSGGSSNASKTGVVQIGLEESQSGDDAFIGVPPADAVQLAVKQINDAGGFKVGDTTYTLGLTNLDDRSQPSQTVANMIKLTKDDGIKFIFGPTLSTLANEAAKVSVANDAIEFSAAGSWQSLGYLTNPKMPLLFGTQVPLASIGYYQALGTSKLGPGIKTVGILTQDDATATANVPPVAKALRDRGFKVLDVRFPTDATSLMPYLTKMKNEGMDVLFFLNPASRTAEAIRDALQLNAAPKGFSTRVDPAVAVKQAIGKPLPVPFFSLQLPISFSNPPNARVKTYVHQMLAAFPKIPLTSANFSFFSYDFVKMLTLAMQKAGTVTDTSAIAAALKTITYDGAVGPVCFAPDQRTSLYPAEQIFVRNGKTTATTFASKCP